MVALIIGLLVVQRLMELVRSKINERFILSEGGKEYFPRNFFYMRLFHTAWLISCALECWFYRSQPILMAIPLFILGQILRILAIETLGPRWNVKIMIIPKWKPIKKGIFKFFPHPNYLGVVLEIAAFPLLLGAPITAVVFSILHLPIIFWRIFREEEALNFTRIKNILILGGGPAGLSSAIQLASQYPDLKICLYEKGKLPHKKPCGEGLLGRSYREFQRFEFDLTEIPHAKLNSIRMIEGENSISAPISQGLGLERFYLSQLLFERAKIYANIHFVDQHPNLNEFDHVIFATGPKFDLSTYGFQKTLLNFPTRWNARQYFHGAHSTFSMNEFILQWRDGGEDYFTPQSPDSFQIAIIQSSSQYDFSMAQNASPTGNSEGMSVKSFIRWKPIRGSFTVIGDAFCMIDPISGDGIGLAFFQSRILAKYFFKPRWVKNILLTLTLIPHGLSCFSLLQISARPQLRKILFRIFERKPFLFVKIVSAIKS